MAYEIVCIALALSSLQEAPPQGFRITKKDAECEPYDRNVTHIFATSLF
jgi:hypothetical protein